MKHNKKLLLIILGMLLLAVVIVAVCIGLRVAPTVNHALHVVELLQPLLDAKNQTVHVAISAEFDGKPLDAESNLYLLTEDGIPFLVVEQNGTSLYISDNVLLLENGKAFKIGDNMQRQAASYQDLLPHLGLLYDTLKITAEETQAETAYSITVTGEQMDTLLAAVSPGETLPVEHIEKLNVCLTKQDEKLERITFSGSGNLEGTTVSLNVTLSEFRILAPGDYPIPEEVKQTAATVDPNELFSLSEDLYRLVVALTSFGKMESINGTLALTVDCGLIQLDTEIKLSDLQTAPSGGLEPEKLQKLPKMLGFLFLEGEISCIQSGDASIYTLVLDEPAMQELSRMILTELGQYGDDLTEGSATVVVKDNGIDSMGLSIGGNINAWIAQIPIAIGAEFSFE